MSPESRYGSDCVPVPPDTHPQVKKSASLLMVILAGVVPALDGEIINIVKMKSRAVTMITLVAVAGFICVLYNIALLLLEYPVGYLL